MQPQSTSAIDPNFDRISSHPLCTIQGHRHLDRFPQAADGETAPSFAAALPTRPDLRPFFAALDLDPCQAVPGRCTRCTAIGNPIPQSLRRHTLFLNLSIATTVQLLHWISPPPVQPNATLSSHLQRTPFLGLPLAAALFPNIPSQHLSPLSLLYSTSPLLSCTGTCPVMWSPWDTFRPQTPFFRSDPTMFTTNQRLILPRYLLPHLLFHRWTLFRTLMPRQGPQTSVHLIIPSTSTFPLGQNFSIVQTHRIRQRLVCQ